MELIALLDRLRLNTLAERLETVCESAAKRELNYKEFLAEALSLEFGDRQRQAQAQGGEGTQQRRQGQCDSQRQPGQRDQFGPVGHANGASLGGQDQDTNEGQTPEVLARSGQRMCGSEHELS